MSTDGNRRTLQQITMDDLELALEALKEYADDSGLTPVKYYQGAKLTPAAILRAVLGLSQNRSTSVMSKLRRHGLVIPTDGSTKVIIASMMTDINADAATPQAGVVTVERIRQALTRLRDENAALRDENSTLRGQVAELEGRVTALEQSAQGLNAVLVEIESAPAA